jgi:hypothetical protein
MIPRSETARRAALAVAGVAAAGLLAWLSVQINLERGCAVKDTPYLTLCPSPSGTQDRLAALRARISANPGDSRAYVQLAFADRSPTRPQSFAAAARLAPTNPNIIAADAAAALERHDWAGAIRPLVNLVEHGANDKAALVLARLIVSGHAALLEPHVAPGVMWLERVLRQMPQAQGAFSTALPLVVLAIDKGILGPAQVTPYIRQLKASRAWVDAYSLWVALHRRTLPLLYNGRFDQPFQEDGFDWEPPPQGSAARAGAFVERAATGDESRGAALDIRFTGRAIPSPLVRQNLFLGPGRYRLRGEYKAAQLRMEQGLAWFVRCAGTESPAARSAGLRDAGSWQPFEFEFSIPAGCGWVPSLQLETVTPYEAAVGSRGRASFAGLSLVKVER